MFILYADNTRLTVRQRDELVSGCVNACAVQFLLSPHWEGLTAVAVFQAGGKRVCALPDGEGMCAVPWEVLASPGWLLRAGLYGMDGERTVLTTRTVNLGTVRRGAAAEGAAGAQRAPTPELWEQGLARKGDRLGLTPDGQLGLYAGDTLLCAVSRQLEHGELSGREEEGAHPVEAIRGLRSILETIPPPMSADQLRKILNGGCIQ